MSETLSQQEIDALLRIGQPEMEEPEELSTDEMDALGEIGNISMGTAATTLSVLLNRKVTITTPKVSVIQMLDLEKEYPRPCVAVEVEFVEGLEGINLLILKDEDAKLITDLLMGGSGSFMEGELTEMHLSAMGEVMNQMIGSASTSLAMIFNHTVNISTPRPTILKLVEEQSSISFGLEEHLIRVAFQMEIEGLLKSQVMQIMSIPFGKGMVEKLFHSSEEPPPVEAPPPMEALPEKPSRVMQPTPPQPKVDVKPVQFQSFEAPEEKIPKAPDNLDIIMDIPLQITVELGKSRKSVREILKMGSGTIIELDRLAGEPVDILVNGKYIAKGEVVVIDENFGVRIHDIISPAKRIHNLS